MPRKRYSPEQVISKLREAEVLLSQGKTTAEVSRSLGVTEHTYYRWRKEYGGMGTQQALRLKELEKENARLTSSRCPSGRSWWQTSRWIKPSCRRPCGDASAIVSPDRRRKAVQEAQDEFQLSERRVCRALGQPRSTQRYVGQQVSDEESLTPRVVQLASQYGRYGYRRITALLRTEGWRVNYKRVERLWRQEGLKVPAEQPKRGRLWLNDGSCPRSKPEFPGHVWGYDFMRERTHDGT